MSVSKATDASAGQEESRPLGHDSRQSSSLVFYARTEQVPRVRRRPDMAARQQRADVHLFGRVWADRRDLIMSARGILWAGGLETS